MNIRFLFTLTLLISIGYAQNFREYPIDTTYNLDEKIYPDRSFTHLTGKWEFDYEDGKSSGVVRVPFLTSNSGKLTLTKKFKVNNPQKSRQYFLVFKGIYGLKEIYINDNRFNFDENELGQYEFVIPGKYIREDSYNKLKVVLSSIANIDIFTHLAANGFNCERELGIYSDVYIFNSPKISINHVRKTVKPISLSNGSFNIDFSLDMTNLYQKNDIDAGNQFELNISVFNQQNFATIATQKQNFTLNQGGNNIIKTGITVSGVNLWSPEKPDLYKFSITVTKNSIELDQYNFITGFKEFDFKDGKFFLNGNAVKINGISYNESNGIRGSYFSYDDIKRDISILKLIGANAVRVTDAVPSDDFLTECDKAGLLVFSEFNNRFIPNSLYKDEKFIHTQHSKLNSLLDILSKHVSIAAVGLGNYNSVESNNYFKSLINIISKQKITLPVYAATDQNLNPEKGLFSFLGLEAFGKDTSEIDAMLNYYRKSGEKVVVLSIGKPNSFGNSNGYSDPYSEESQAKYLAITAGTMEDLEIPYFVYSFADYRIGYNSIYAGETDNRLLGCGLLNEYRDQKKPSFAVIQSYFLNEKLPIITHGSVSDKSIVIFTVFGIFTIFSFIILINSTRRFREYALRSLTRSYNFFSDIRDQRIFSVSQTFLLAVIISFSMSLIYSSILFYFKDKIYFERLLLSFNSQWLLEILSYLAWRPMHSLGYFSLFFFVVLLALTLKIKIFNYAVKSKIYLSHAYIVAVWAMLPFIISLPLSIVCYKILTYDTYNFLIYVLIIAFHLWAVMRLFKGISIIYDVRQGKIVLYATGLIILFTLAFLLYLESSNSTIIFLRYFLKV